MKTMGWIALWGAAALVSAAFWAAVGPLAWGQTMVAVPLDRAEFVWEHPDPASVATWRFRCDGTTVDVPVAEAPGLRVPLGRVITQPGVYTCDLRAANEFGESDPSNAVSFRAGVAPPPPGSLRIEAR